jgi:hypothetical protein
MWKLKTIRRNADGGIRHLCLGEGYVKHMSLYCLETGKWRRNFVNEKCLSVE